MWKAIAEILKAIFGALFDQWNKEGKKPKDVKPAGYDEDIQNDINHSIEGQAGLARCRYCKKPIERFDVKCGCPEATKARGEGR